MPRTTHSDRRKLSVPTVARMLGVATQKVMHWIHNGELKATNLARNSHGRPRYAIDVGDIEAFERSRQVSPQGGKATTPKRRRVSGTVKKFF